MRMLLRLLLWIVVATAALAWLWPGALTLAAAGAPAAVVLTAFASWRAAVRRATQASAPVPGPGPAQPLGAGALGELTQALERRVRAAGSLDTALHDVAALLRSELGVGRTAVHRVHGIDASGVRLSELLQAYPQWPSPERHVRADAEPAAVAAFEGRCVGDTARGWAVPVRGPDGVVAVLCLTTPAIPVAADPLRELLERAAASLSGWMSQTPPRRRVRAGGSRFVRSVTPRPLPWAAARHAGRCRRECAGPATGPAPSAVPGSQQGVLPPAMAGGARVGDNDRASRRRSGRLRGPRGGVGVGGGA